MQYSAARLVSAITLGTLALSGTALLARPGGWGGSPWGMSGPYGDRSVRSAPTLEGQIDVARFRADGVDLTQLHQGEIVVIRMPGDEGTDDTRQAATYEAAVEGALVRSGYVAAPGGSAGGQIAEVRIVRSEAEPAEQKRKPVSGEMTLGVSNRGTMMGMAIAIDGTKPRSALIATRLETRIRDRASGAVLWEGRAQMFSREGDERWTDDAIAARLAKSLFTGFPEKTGEAREKR